MTEKQLHDLWKKILADIETEVSEANYFTLFKQTYLLSCDNNIATIACSSSMVINLLQKRFSSIIKICLDKHTGKDTSLVFIPKTIPLKPPRKEEAGPLFTQTEEQEETASALPLRQLSRVRPDFTFETMAVSSSNQLAFVSAQTVAKNIGTSYNPLFIYGPVGVGKTHLMQAIANEVYRSNAERKIIYITSEEFTNEVVEAIRANDTARMKRRFRNIDLLIIDDVQFIAGKDRVQEELFHTFNILIDKSSQVVLSSERPPQEIKKLEKRLSSRFLSGLTVDIEPPDFELKTAILLIKSKKNGVEIPIEAAKLIAQTTEDIRSLEGVLLRVITEARSKKQDVTLEFVSHSLKSKNNNHTRRFHPEEIIKEVCGYYDLKSTLIKGPRRNSSLVRARQIIMYLLKNELKLTYTEIGNLLGGRDHTTIMYGVEKVEKMLTIKGSLSLEIVQITKQVSEKNVY